MTADPTGRETLFAAEELTKAATDIGLLTALALVVCACLYPLAVLYTAGVWANVAAARWAWKAWA